jgi:hypothetical protein
MAHADTRFRLHFLVGPKLELNIVPPSRQRRNGFIIPKNPILLRGEQVMNRRNVVTQNMKRV